MTYLSRALALFSLVLTLAFTSAPAFAEEVPFNRLDRAVAMSIADAMRALGLPRPGAGFTAQVTVANCPASCNAEVHGGMCYCARQSGNRCADGQTETSWGGKPMCKVLPDTAGISGGDLGSGRFQTLTLTGG